MIVLDASVILNWLIEERESTHALRYRGDHVSGENPVAVPDLLFYELANALATKTGLSAAQSRRAFEVIWNMELESHDLDGSGYLRAMALAHDLGISAYDAAYVALAEELDVPFVTADAKLLKRCAPLGFVEKVD